MPSIVPGYEYDIFISYRHKDNKGAQWVSEFVNALKTELEATFKEDVSIYFDTNPHDGILETHSVHESLRHKLKCLIFIPIISQTYCDVKSFAWQHELCVFNQQAKEDALGRDIKLRNGNVTSRILPVRIHDLDSNDLKMLSDELGGPLRSIDFIYKEAGVNRPLSAKEEHSSKNQNQTLYRNQINKVANAIKEIIESIARPVEPGPTDVRNKISPPTNSGNRKKSMIVLFIFAAALFAGYFAYQKSRSRSDSDDSFEKSIAVLPFLDMSPDGDMGYLGDGIAEEIINSLASIKSLKVVGRTSSFQFKGEKSDLREVGEKLQVGIVLEGSVRKFEGHFRITAKLVRTGNNVQIWSEEYNLDETNLFKIQDNIAVNVAEKLKLTLSAMEQTKIVKKEIDPEAYNLFLKGLHQYKAQKYQESIEYEQAVLKIDSTYSPALAIIGLSKTWLIFLTPHWADTVAINEALNYSERAIAFDPELAEGYSAIALISWSIQHNFPKARIYFEKSIELNPSSSLILNRYAYFLTWMGDFKKASELAMKAMRIDPVDYNSYAILFNTGVNSGQLDEAARYEKERGRIFGSDRQSVSRDINIALNRGDYKRVVSLSDSLTAKGVTFSNQDLSFLTVAHYSLGQISESNKILAQLKARTNSGDDIFFDIATVYARRHQADSCFKYLNISYQSEERSFNHLKISPAFADLRKDPRYIKLYSDAGFDKY
ncbi:MAG: hypothetical protein ABIS36_11075 [Chryseolinea sp.]